MTGWPGTNWIPGGWNPSAEWCAEQQWVCGCRVPLPDGLGQCRNPGCYMPVWDIIYPRWLAEEERRHAVGSPGMERPRR